MPVLPLVPGLSLMVTETVHPEDCPPGSWFIVVERQTYDFKPWPDGDVVIGPFDTEEAAREHMDNSTDLDDWTYAEAKAAGYLCDDVYLTQAPPETPHGINAPIYFDTEED